MKDIMLRRSRWMLLAALILALGVLLGGMTASYAVDGPERHQYTLEFRLDTEQCLLCGTETVQVVNNSDCDWAELCFRDYATVVTLSSRDGYRDENGGEVFIEPDGDSSQYSDIVDLDTGAALSYTRREEDPSVVYISLDEPLKPGQRRTIQFTYQARIFHGRGNLSWYQQNGSTYFNLGNFYPVLTCFEDGAWSAYPYTRWGEYFYSPVSDYQVSLTAPAAYIPAVSSAIAAADENGDGTITWRCSPATLRDFALCLSDGFVMKSKTLGDTTILSYCSAASEEKGEANLDAAARALELFGETFGYPYPYETFSVVETPHNLAGMEFPGLVMIHDSGSASTVAHETAHQWFYAVVGSNSGQEPWLDEAFATFGEMIYLKEAEPDRYADALLQYRLLGEGNEEIRLDGSAGDMGEAYYTRIAYYRGASFLYDLCQAMGEERFYAALSSYVNAFVMDEAHTSDFVRIFLRECAGNAQAQSVIRQSLFPVFDDLAERPDAAAASLAAAYGLMTGTSERSFSPEGVLTRAQAVTILYRLAGSPLVYTEAGFSDVPAGSWYDRAVGWAKAEGITNGVSQNQFAPERTVTKEEFQALLSRYFGQAEESAWDGGSSLTRIEAAEILESRLKEANLI